MNMKGVTEYSKAENIDLTAFLAGHDILLYQITYLKVLRLLKTHIKKEL